MLLGDKLMFMAEEACYRALKKTDTFSGYWVTGPEYSVFYPDAKSLTLEFDTDAVWLDTSKELNTQVQPLMDWKGHVAEVEFIGIESNRPGFYGHMGAFKRGILVTRFMRLKEVDKSVVSAP